MSKWSEDLPKDLQNKIEIVDEKISSKLEDITEIVLNNQRRVLELFRKHHVAEEDLVGSTGYGYDDIGRDKLDAMFADYFKTEDAMVRPQLTSRSEEHTSELQSRFDLVCRLLLEKK